MSIFVLDEKWKVRLEKMWAWQRGFTAAGDGVYFKNSEGSASLSVRQTPGKSTTSPSSLLLARITSVSGTGAAAKYAWEQVRPLAAGGVEAVPGGQTGLTTDDSYAREANGKDVTTGAIVWLGRAARDDGTAGWEFIWEGCKPDPNQSVSHDFVTGVTWNAGGNDKLQYMKMTMTIDSCGNITFAGPDTVDVDTAEDCIT